MKKGRRTPPKQFDCPSVRCTNKMHVASNPTYFLNELSRYTYMVKRISKSAPPPILITKSVIPDNDTPTFQVIRLRTPHFRTYVVWLSLSPLLLLLLLLLQLAQERRRITWHVFSVFGGRRTLGETEKINIIKHFEFKQDMMEWKYSKMVFPPFFLLLLCTIYLTHFIFTFSCLTIPWSTDRI